MNLKIQGVHESRHLPHNIALPHTPAFSTSVVDSSMLFSRMPPQACILNSPICYFSHTFCGSGI